MCSHLDVSYRHFSLNIVADHKISQVATGGKFGLLDNVGAKGDFPDVILIFDHGGDGKLKPAWSTKTGSASLKTFFCCLFRQIKYQTRI